MRKFAFATILLLLASCAPMHGGKPCCCKGMMAPTGQNMEAPCPVGPNGEPMGCCCKGKMMRENHGYGR